MWRTTRNNNALLDSASFPTAVWEWLIEKPQVCSPSLGLWVGVRALGLR